MIRVRFRRTELSEGTTETFDADNFEVLSDNTVRLLLVVKGEEEEKLIGLIHRDRWESVFQVAPVTT